MLLPEILNINQSDFFLVYIFLKCVIIVYVQTPPFVLFEGYLHLFCTPWIRLISPRCTSFILKSKNYIYLDSIFLIVLARWCNISAFCSVLKWSWNLKIYNVWCSNYSFSWNSDDVYFCLHWSLNNFTLRYMFLKYRVSEK